MMNPSETVIGISTWWVSSIFTPMKASRKIRLCFM